MSLKPIINSGQNDGNNTQSFTTESIANRMLYDTLQTRALVNKGKKVIKDPYGIIPNGIYKVFKLEKNVKLASIITCLVFFFLSLIATILFATTPQLFLSNNSNQKIKWGWYIIPSVIMLLSAYTTIIELIELIGISKSVVVYRDSIKMGAISTPPFITLLYRKLILKQVRRTWLVVAILFYVGLFTLTFWALKDVKWRQLDFKTWIHSSFPNPNLVVYILCGLMSAVLISYIAFTIFRKKRTIDIQSFFGTEVMDYNELQEKKSKAHRFYAKIFFLSILLLLLLPFIIYIIVKKIRRSK